LKIRAFISILRFCRHNSIKSALRSQHFYGIGLDNLQKTKSKLFYDSMACIVRSYFLKKKISFFFFPYFTGQTGAYCYVILGVVTTR